MYKYLFFDDQRLFGRDNVERCYGEPTLLETSVYYDGMFATNTVSPFVFKKDDGKYRMIYQGKHCENGRRYCLIAVSDDGIHFEPEAVDTSCDIAPHAIFEIGNNEIAYIVEDKYNSPDERYKMLYCETDVDALYVNDVILVSSDLVHWRKLEGALWNDGAEPCVGVFYNKHKKCFTILTRPDWGTRRVGITETRDWRTYTPYEICLQCDSLDAPLDEIYGMPAFEYDGWYIAMPYIYGNNKSCFSSKYFGGTMKAQLAYSLDGRHWQRSLRESFISGDKLCDIEKLGYANKLVWVADMLRCEDGGLNIYASATKSEHGYAFEDASDGKIQVYSLREDGFICLKTQNEECESVIATRENIWLGGELAVNIKCKRATVAVYESTGDANVGGCCDLLEGYTHEDCIPFEGDSTAWIPAFKNGNTIDMLKNRTVSFEIKFEDGEIYSVSGECIPVMNLQSARYKKFGKMPDKSRI